MSYTCLSDQIIKKSRKEYHCDSCHAILNEINMDELKDLLTEDEFELMQKAKEDKFKIKIGESYQKTIGIYDGDFQVFKSKIGYYKLVDKLQIFENY